MSQIFRCEKCSKEWREGSPSATCIILYNKCIDCKFKFDNWNDFPYKDWIELYNDSKNPSPISDNNVDLRIMRNSLERFVIELRFFKNDILERIEYFHKGWFVTVEDISLAAIFNGEIEVNSEMNKHLNRVGHENWIDGRRMEMKKIPIEIDIRIKNES